MNFGFWIFDFGFFDFGGQPPGFRHRVATPKSKIQNPKSKMESALLLLVTRVLADHANYILALDDLAAFAKPFDGCSDFHGFFSL
jgi:hypothetical protein